MRRYNEQMRLGCHPGLLIIAVHVIALGAQGAPKNFFLKATYIWQMATK
jgi:hypothetical protein